MINSAIRRRRTAWLALAAGLSLIAGTSVVQVGEASAQSRAGEVSVVAPRALQLAPGSEAPLGIQVGPGGALPRRAILLIRGLPSSVALSEGRLFESGVWGVAAADLGRVKINTSSSATGRSDLDFTLVAIDGTVLAEAKSTLVIGGSPAMARKTDPSDNTVYTATSPQEIPADADISAPPPSVAKRLSAEQNSQLLALVKKGDEQLRVGNISAAQLLYRHAAESGLAAAALALAATYDENELQKLQVRGGVHADPKQAQFWYQKAQELGSPEARSRLQRLGAR